MPHTVQHKLSWIVDSIKPYLRFMSGGVPGFLLAIVLNWLLVDGLHTPVLLAYIIVLIFQIIVNFLICHYIVFKKRQKPTWRTAIGFVQYVIVFQGISWCTYAAMITYLHIYYLIAQLLNIGILSVFKYIWASRIFKGQ